MSFFILCCFFQFLALMNAMIMYDVKKREKLKIADEKKKLFHEHLKAMDARNGIYV